MITRKADLRVVSIFLFSCFETPSEFELLISQTEEIVRPYGLGLFLTGR
jgi:hypothetical protein